MKRCYLVCYDISDPKRLRRVHRVVGMYGEPWQYSVFFCVLKRIDAVRLQNDLRRELNQGEDQALILDLGVDEEAARKAALVIGRGLPDPHGSVDVV